MRLRPRDRGPRPGTRLRPRDEAPPRPPPGSGLLSLPGRAAKPSLLSGPPGPHYSERAAAQPGSPSNPAWSWDRTRAGALRTGSSSSLHAHLSPTAPPTLGPQIHPLSPSFTPCRRDSAHLPGTSTRPSALLTQVAWATRLSQRGPPWRSPAHSQLHAPTLLGHCP